MSNPINPHVHPWELYEQEFDEVDMQLDYIESMLEDFITSNGNRNLVLSELRQIRIETN